MDPVPSPRASSPVASVPPCAHARTDAHPDFPRVTATGQAPTAGNAPATNRAGRQLPGWRLLFVLSALLLNLSSCAERDNPFDPANRPASPWGEFVPTPGPGRLVLDPSVPADPPYRFQDLQEACKSLQGGDTLWIRGPKDYWLQDPIFMNTPRSGTNLPIVIRPYGGDVRLSNRTRRGFELINIQSGGGNVSFEHLTFGPSTGDGVLMWGVLDPVWFRDCVFDKNQGFGLFATAPNPRQDPTDSDVTLPLPISILLDNVLFQGNGKAVPTTVGKNESQLQVPQHILDSSRVTFSAQ